MKGKIAIAHAYMKPYRGGVKEVYNDEGQIYVTVIYPDGDCEDVLLTDMIKETVQHDDPYRRQRQLQLTQMNERRTGQTGMPSLQKVRRTKKTRRKQITQSAQRSKGAGSTKMDRGASSKTSNSWVVLSKGNPAYNWGWREPGLYLGARAPGGGGAAGPQRGRAFPRG